PAFTSLRQSQTSKLVCVMGSQAWKHGGPVDAVALSPDGTKGISGGAEGAARLWDLETGACIRTLIAGTAWIQDVAFFPDGKRVLVAKSGRRLDVIDVKSGATKRSIDTEMLG